VHCCWSGFLAATCTTRPTRLLHISAKAKLAQMKETPLSNVKAGVAVTASAAARIAPKDSSSSRSSALCAFSSAASEPTLPTGTSDVGESRTALRRARPARCAAALAQAQKTRDSSIITESQCVKSYFERQRAFLTLALSLAHPSSLAEIQSKS